MQLPTKRAGRFVRALLAGGDATRSAELFRVAGVKREVSLEAAAVRDLISAGVLEGSATTCRAAEGARSWVRRQLAETDSFAEQHGEFARNGDAVLVNLAESPLGRLAAASGASAPFLLPHQVEAGNRVRKLVARAQLQPRLTMTYSAAHTAGGRRTAGGTQDISEMAAEARKALNDLWRALPQDCARVVLDVCGLEKGLQTIESERGWPRRSAKLVLRIGLEQLAAHWGLAPTAVGRERGAARAWMDEGARPTIFS